MPLTRHGGIGTFIEGIDGCPNTSDIDSLREEVTVFGFVDEPVNLRFPNLHIGYRPS